MANIYKGFSTVNKIRAPYTLTDAELVKTDLLNELNTRQGERVMRPTFGTRIFDILMNPLDEYVVNEVEEDVIRIVNKDPRVELQTVKTDVVQTSSSSFTDVTGLSVSITPSATTSKILCICTGIYGKTTNDNFHHQLVRDSTALLANILDPGTDTNQTEVFSVQFLDSPSSTSALTYKLQIKNDGTNPVNINRNNAGCTDRGDSTITVMEVLA